LSTLLHFFFYFGEGFFIPYKQRENKKIQKFDRYYRRLQHSLNFDHKFKLVMSVGFGNIG